jgi:hypothetical protein
MSKQVTTPDTDANTSTAMATTATMLEQVRAWVSITQDNKDAVAFGMAAARILERCIHVRTGAMQTQDSITGSGGGDVGGDDCDAAGGVGGAGAADSADGGGVGAERDFNGSSGWDMVRAVARELRKPRSQRVGPVTTADRLVAWSLEAVLPYSNSGSGSGSSSISLKCGMPYVDATMDLIAGQPLPGLA